MILQIRTETHYSIEMTEAQIQELSIVFEGLQESDINNAVKRMKGEQYRATAAVHETVQTFRHVIAEHQKV